MQNCLKTSEYPFADGNMHPYRAFQYRLPRECNNIGIKGVHVHRLRHSLGHYLRANKGFDLEEIRQKLRHADISTTQIYAQSTKEEVDKKIDDEVFENE